MNKSNSVVAIGIDVGTTVSKTAYVDPTGRPVSVPNKRGDFGTPSVICFEKGEPALIGIEAQYEGYVHPEKVVAHFKRYLGETQVLFKGKKDYTPTDLAARMIEKLKVDVERRTNTTVDQAVFSCPANFMDDAKQALLDAAKQTGIEPLGLINEPTAAGLAYTNNKQHDQSTAVFDFGGGTLDVSILEVAGNSITVKATGGVAKLGGYDFTARIEDWILDNFKKKTKYTPTKNRDPLFFQEVYQKAEAAKIALTERKKINIVIGCRGKQAILELKREDFVSLCQDLFNQSLQCADKVVQDAGYKWTEINSLIMVGGSSRMPYIQEKIADLTGLVPKMDLEPDTVVSKGAALKAREILGERGVLPRSEIFVKEVTAHGLGCAVLKPGGKGEGDLVQAVIIPKNTPIPAQKTDQFYLEHEDQDTATLVIAQGDEGRPLKECLKIGELILANLPKEAKRTQRIKVDYGIDANGMAFAVATDLVSGTKQSTSVDFKAGIKNRN